MSTKRIGTTMEAPELILRIVLALLLPPLGIIGLPNVGCGTFLLLVLLTIFFWVPGQVVAIIMIAKEYGK